MYQYAGQGNAKEDKKDMESFISSHTLYEYRMNYHSHNQRGENTGAEERYLRVSGLAKEDQCF